MYRIAVCDDNPVFLKTLCDTLESWARLNFINTEVIAFHDGIDLLENIREYGHYEIVFLDIEIGSVSGLTLAGWINQQGSGTMIIFMSAFDHYFKQAYQVHPYYFFSKPIYRKELFAVMGRAIDRLKTDNQDFRFQYKMVYYSVSVRNIIYFFSEKRRIGIICRDGKAYWFYGRLDEVEQLMRRKAELFIRIHKSYFINVRHIVTYHYDYVEMSNGEKLSISQTKRKDIRRMQATFPLDI